MADAADQAWTIAMATGSTPLLPHITSLRHSGGGLNVAARHVLLVLYLHHRDLHLPDPQLPAPQAATPTPEALADTAPEEIAAFLRITYRRFNANLTHSAHSSTRRTPRPPRAAEAPGGLGVLFEMPTWSPPTKQPPRGWTPRASAPTSEASRHASERRIAGTPTPRRPHGDRWVHPPPTATGPRRPRQIRGPASAPASRTRRPDQGPGSATPHHPTPRPTEHTNSIAPTNAHRHHHTTAP